MTPTDFPIKCEQSFLYLSFIFTSLYVLHCSVLQRFLLGHEQVHIKKSADLPLRFRSDGTFKILQVSDMHFGNGAATRCRDVLPSEFGSCSDLNTTRFVRRLIEAERPDFIAFTGDNIFGQTSVDAAESMFRAFTPAMESKLPWAAILGNHDQESTMTREELMSFISLMDYSISEINPPAEKGIHGFGNYHLQVHGVLGSSLANSSVLNLFFLDSGDREVVNGRRTYGWIRESQLCWLQGLSQKLQYGGRWEGISTDSLTPALAFFHIPIPEIWDLWYKKFIGQFQEAVACSSVNSGVLRAFVSTGDIKAAFMGHDHKNDFCGNLNGIWFCYGGGSGYHGYGMAGWPRRARVIQAELEQKYREWTGVKRISTWKRLDNERLSVIDDQVLWELQ
ncbi:hypothetical protein CRG98_022918 [Punica granatum]|uniref:Calcineurin-like phosphoesterase domain-containing protein n=1 Tax=Punica granatum TaxID=22663 RepID=A0A2I0JK78_PUNGR|nr:hypothetical protein CRG98_022918 [Punica granatum]